MGFHILAISVMRRIGSPGTVSPDKSGETRATTDLLHARAVSGSPGASPVSARAVETHTAWAHATRDLPRARADLVSI